MSVLGINKKKKEKKMLMGWWGSQGNAITSPVLYMWKIQYSSVLGVRAMPPHPALPLLLASPDCKPPEGHTRR